MTGTKDREMVRLYNICENGHTWESFIAPGFAARAVERQNAMCLHGLKHEPKFPYRGIWDEACGSRQVVTALGDVTTWETVRKLVGTDD